MKLMGVEKRKKMRVKAIGSLATSVTRAPQAMWMKTIPSSLIDEI